MRMYTFGRITSASDSAGAEVAAAVADEQRSKVDQGVGIRANLLAVRVALANGRQLRLQMQNYLTVAQAAYNRTLQRSLDMPVGIQDLAQPAPSFKMATQGT